MRDMAAAVATLDPDAAANMAHAPTLEIAKPPGRRTKNMRRAVNNPSVSRVAVQI